MNDLDDRPRDALSRTRLLLGEEALARLARAHVAVVGLGAVGGHATEALARSGVGRLRLVEFDRVDPPDLNRQLLALYSTMGAPKGEVAAARVRDIQPGCAVEVVPAFFRADTAEAVLEGPPDLVVDAIDSLNSKVELLATCLRRGLPVVSSMGAAMRTDPSRVRVGTLAGTAGCPLARMVRKRLRRRGFSLEVPVVYSDEPVDAFFGEGLERTAAGSGPRGRHRNVLGSLATVPGIVGLTLAHEALRLLLAPMAPPGGRAPLARRGPGRGGSSPG